MTKLLLINPNYRSVYSYAGSETATPIYPPLGLAYLAAVVRQNLFDVKILEANALNLSHEQIKKEIISFNPDYVALTASSSMMNEVNKLINLCPENVKVIFGGIHASSLPEQVLTEYPKISIIVRGEGEETIVHLLEGKKYEEIDGISYRKDNKIIHNKDSKFIEDLDSLPFPARDLLPMHKYFSFEARKYPIDWIVTGRGCPYRCTFCFHPEMEIITKEGIKPIKDIKVGEEVLTHDGTYARTDFTFERYYHGKMVRIKSSGLPKDIICTPNHKLLVIKNNSKPKLIAAEELEIGDILTGPSININQLKSIQNNKDGTLQLVKTRLIRMNNCFKIDSINEEKYEGLVYNLSVPGNRTYVCNFVAVSNCADFITSGRKLRVRSAENIVAEIEHLVENYGTQEIDFQDDNFTLYPDRVKKFCELMIEKGLNKNVTWKIANGVRCDKLNLPMLKHMKKAGCYMLSLGIESGNQEILNRMRKAEKLEDIKNAAKWCRIAGIETRGLFIFGNLGENEKTMIDTIEFAKNLPLDTATFHVMIPMPGTELYNVVKKEGKFLDVGWEGYTAYSEGAFIHKDVTPELMSRMQKKAYREFYLRPYFIIRRLRRIKTLKEIRQTIKGGMEVLKFAKA